MRLKDRVAVAKKEVVDAVIAKEPAISLKSLAIRPIDANSNFAAIYDNAQLLIFPQELLLQQPKTRLAGLIVHQFYLYRKNPAADQWRGFTEDMDFEGL